MTKISRDDIASLATMSSLQLDGDEAEALTADLANILEYIDQLQHINTDGVEPTYYVHGQSSVVREDAVSQQVGHEQLMSNVPFSNDGSIVVPRVIE
tara:strand:- start:38 stop:328 length:291 start_codon:yes stop_codon:yes gene_type:complete